MPGEICDIGAVQCRPSVADFVHKWSLQISGKIKNKRRNRPKLETLNTNRLTIKDSLDDRDETSSTTTESSTGDAEDKSSSPGDSTPEPPQLRTKLSKKKGKSLERMYSAPLKEDCNNYDDFELTSKSKALKRVKTNSKDTYGGNIYEPSSIDLPYTLEPQIDTNKKEDVTLEGQKVKKIKSPLVKSKSETDADMSDWSNEAPEPVWELPSLDYTPDDLSELSIQTENFTHRHLKTLANENQVNGYSPEPMTSSSRSSSYSDIVSNNSSETNGKAKVKSPTDKRFPASFYPFGENSIPGTIGSKTAASKTSVIGTGKLRTPWTTPASSTDTLGPSFGLHTIQEGQRPVPTTVTETQMDSYNQPEYSFGLPATSVDNSLYGFGTTAQDSQSLTMMQRLQWERRQRVREHQMRVLKGDDWPGFDVPLVRSDSLWDAEYTPPNAWSTGTDSPPPTVTIPETSGSFHLFDSMTDIWGPQASGSNPSWSFPAKETEEEN
ncbi:hypothetical protein ScPMuIL_010771 [Solemya velum]